MRHGLYQKLYHFSNQTDLLLAWLAIFLWGTAFTWEYTRLEGFMDFVYRLSLYNWQSFTPIKTGTWLMLTLSIFYWLALIGVLTMFGLFVWRIVRQV